MSSPSSGGPAPWLPDAVAFQAEDWRLLIGDFVLRTGTWPDELTRSVAETWLELAATGDPPRLGGQERYSGPEPGQVFWQPVALDGVASASAPAANTECSAFRRRASGASGARVRTTGFGRYSQDIPSTQRGHSWRAADARRSSGYLTWR